MCPCSARISQQNEAFVHQSICQALFQPPTFGANRISILDLKFFERFPPTWRPPPNLGVPLHWHMPSAGAPPPSQQHFEIKPQCHLLTPFGPASLHNIQRNQAHSVYLKMYVLLVGQFPCIVNVDTALVTDYAFIGDYPDINIFDQEIDGPLDVASCCYPGQLAHDGDDILVHSLKSIRCISNGHVATVFYIKSWQQGSKGAWSEIFG